MRTDSSGRGARLFSRTSRVVGWGSGSVFDYFHGLYPIRLDYLVDNDFKRDGVSAGNGVEIVSPGSALVRGSSWKRSS